VGITDSENVLKLALQWAKLREQSFLFLIFVKTIYKAVVIITHVLYAEER